MLLKDIKQINKFKAYYKAGLTNDGEKCFFSVNINKELQQLLKKVVIKDIEKVKINTGRDEEGNTQTEEFKRYKVKTTIYTSLNQTNKASLFIISLVDKGKVTFNFSNIPFRDSFKTEFEQLMNDFIRVLQKAEVEQTISYTINPIEKLG